jgi:hypothetical protein
VVSETPTEGKCNYEYDESDDYPHDSGYCEGDPMDNGWCYHHGGQRENGGAPEDNQNAKRHGAFSEHFRSDLTDDEKQALDALVSHLESIDDERTLAAEIAAEALLKYKRSADSRFLREARQWFGDFNLLPNEDELNIGGQSGNPLEVVMNETVHETGWSDE